MLLWNIAEFGLCAVEEPFAHQAARTYGNFTLVHIVALASHVVFNGECHLDTHLLVRFQHLVKRKIHGKKQAHASNRKTDGGKDFPVVHTEKFPYQIDERADNNREEEQVAVNVAT